MTSPPISRRTPATAVRTNLIRAGRTILERDGVAGLTIRAVAKEAGVAPMGVYNHFDGKDGLLDALVSDAFVEFGIAIGTTDDDPAERLRGSGRAYREFALRYPVVYALMFSSRCQADPEASNAAFMVLADLIRYGQTANIIRGGDPMSLAMQVWSCVHGAVGIELAGAIPSFIDAADNYEQVLSVIARGMTP